MHITGSKTSSTEEFIKEVAPKTCMIGVGKDNNFGHPNEEVLERLQALNVKIYRTDEDGEISTYVNSKGEFKVRKLIKQKSD